MKHSYTQPADQQSGARTYVKDPSPSTPTDEGHEKERVLPSPPWERSKPLPNGGTPQFGKPPGSDGALDEKPLSTERVRTLGKPGDDSPPDDSPARSTPVRRPGLEAAVQGPQYPGANRQHEQGGKAKRYYEKYYRKNKGRIKNRSERWLRHWKNQRSYKKDKTRREKTPQRYERRHSQVRNPADRSKAWREEHGQKKATVENGMGIQVQYLPTGMDAYIVGLDDQSVTLHFVDTHMDDSQDFPLEVLFDHLGFYHEADIDLVYDQLDQVFDHESESKVAARYADFLYEKRGPDKEPGQNFDRASPAHHMWPEHDPSNDLDTGTVWDNPGSAKVIPEGHDFENKADRFLEGSAVRVAMRISEIQERTGPKVHGTARQVRVKLTRVDMANNMWMFDVPGSQGTYKVRVKASPKGNVTDVNKMDIHVACTCPFWRWQGPEHWARQSDYLYGKPAGTASQPVIKDPDAKHWACKHVLACFDWIQTNKWRIPMRKNGSLIISNVVSRYLRHAWQGLGTRNVLAVLGNVRAFKIPVNKASPKVATPRLLDNTRTHGGAVIQPDYPMPIRVAARYLERMED